jgi:phosphate transporter
VVSFGGWMCISLPFGVMNTVLAWAYLIVVVRPDDISTIPLIVYERGKVLGKRNLVVIVTSLLTILLFANFTYVECVFGEIGIVAALYVVFMYGSGILSEVRRSALCSDCGCCD